MNNKIREKKDEDGFEYFISELVCFYFFTRLSVSLFQ